MIWKPIVKPMDRFTALIFTPVLSGLVILELLNYWVWILESSFRYLIEILCILYHVLNESGTEMNKTWLATRNCLTWKPRRGMNPHPTLHFDFSLLISYLGIQWRSCLLCQYCQVKIVLETKLQVFGGFIALFSITVKAQKQYFKLAYVIITI